MIFLYIALILIFLAAVIFFAVAYKIFLTTCLRRPPKHTEFDDMFSEKKLSLFGVERLRGIYDWYMSTEQKEVCITARDGLKLYATAIPTKAASSRGAVIFFHGYRSSCVRDLGVQAKLLHEQGYDLLICDQRSHGRCDGKYICYGVLERYDVLLWCEEAKKLFGNDLPIALMGLSMGAATVVMASGIVDKSDKNVKCVIADCPFSSPWDIVSHVMLTKHHIKPKPIIYAVDVWCRILAKFSLRTTSSAESAARSHLPLLLYHGKEDAYVPPKHSDNIKAAAPERVELVKIDGAEHAEALFFDEKLYTDSLLAFLDKHMKM